MTKRDVESKGDSGLLHLSADDTVFYVGGYPDTFSVRVDTNTCLYVHACVCVCVCGGGGGGVGVVLWFLQLHHTCGHQ